MDFRMLGPLEVYGESGQVSLGGAKPRAVMALLLLHANEPVTAERVALALWGADVPTSAIKTVQVYISRLRKSLGEHEVLTSTRSGYVLRVRRDELDAERFTRLVEVGRRALDARQPETAATVLREALALWRGPPLADLTYESFVAAEIARLEEQRLGALELRIEADLAAGRHASLTGELRELVATYPTREQLAGHLMVALYCCGRQSDALEVFRATRQALLAEVGVEPGHRLRRLQEAILRQDAALEPEIAVRELPYELDASMSPPLEGRREELAHLHRRWNRAQHGSGGVVKCVGVRGVGKLRLAAELATAVHADGAEVMYASACGPEDVVLTAFDRAGTATRPTLLVVADVDRAGEAHTRMLDALRHDLERLPVLVVACGEDGASPGLRAEDTLVLGALDANAVAAIARRYVRRETAEDVPADRLLQASDGIPLRVHEVAREWARSTAARHVGASARRAGAGRADLRTTQAALTDDVVGLQEARASASLRGFDAPVVCPFKGLASFDAVDADYFFGRETLVAELVAQLVGSQLLGIVGPSGSGKSSVMRAGLLPALASGVLPGSEEWHQLLIRPGEHPLRELADATARIREQDRAVIAVDQFEETFTTCQSEAERAAFIGELGRIASDHDGGRVVVIALRADFYGRCAEYAELATMLASNHVLVRSMRRDELMRAITLPAQRGGLQVDSDLADALVADVKDEPGSLPLLSTALLELWQRRDGRRLRYAAYEQTGGVRGAVARLAEDAFGDLDVEQRVVARGVLMRLAEEGPSGGVERRRVAVAELAADDGERVSDVLAVLTDRRLLTASTGSVELAHEALLREWPRLRDWIDADRDGLRIHRNLSAAALQWEELHRDEGALYRGIRLAEAMEWNAGNATRLNEVEARFLEASAEAGRRERVTRRRRLALAFGSLTVALLAISGVAVTSVIQGRETASRELANRSQVVLPGDPGQALAIALDALRRHDTPEADSAVRQATLADRATAVVRVHRAPIYRAALSPDGSRIATAGDDGYVRIVSLGDARVISTIKGHEGPVLDVSFSPDGTRVASVGLDGVVAVADLDGGRRRVLMRFGGSPGPYPRSVEHSPDGSELLIAATDGTIRRIRLRDGHIEVVARHSGVRVARFDRLGRRVLSAGADGYARVWTLTGRMLASFAHGNGVDLFDAAFSPDGRRIATAAGDGAVRIWHARSGRLLRKLALDLQPLYSLQFSADGERIVTGGDDGVVRISDVRGGQVLAELKGHRDRVYDAGFGARGSAYSIGTDGTLRLWAPPKVVVLPADAAGAPFAPAFSPIRAAVVSGYDSGVRLWNPETGAWRELAADMTETAAAYSPDGTHIVMWSSTYGKGAMRIYDVARGTSRVVRVPSHPGVLAAAIDSSGRRIARAGLEARVVVQSPDGRRRFALPEHGQVDGLAFSPNGRHLVTASEDGAVRMWNAASGARERVLEGIQGAALSAAWSPDSKRVAASGADGSVRIWSVAGGEAVALFGHEGPVNAVAFNRRGDRLVSGGKDGTVRVWDATTGNPLVVLHKHEGEVNGVGFGPDGNDVVSGSDDGLRVSACEVCGTLRHVVALAATRPRGTR